MTDDMFTLLLGDCRDRLAELEDDSVDAIVTDPPYELGFMGKRWDASGIAYDVTMWAECLRVVKPGGYLLAFGGTRTYHRMVCAIEDAGFEVRDSIHWLYGSGFPKSLDVAKAIDKTAGIWRGRAGNVQSPNGSMNSGNYERTEKGDPVTEAALEWEGWGTALKPAHEPIVVARKPFAGTVADNVQRWGTGALNIDGCRIETTDSLVGWNLIGGTGTGWDRPGKSDPAMVAARVERAEAANAKANDLGRWPANVLLTHTAECRNVAPENAVPVFACASGCPVPILDQQSGMASGGVPSSGGGSGGIWGRDTVYNGEPVGPCYGDAGGASRFFAASEWSPEFDVPFIYTAKPSRAERNDGLGHLPGGHTDFGGNGRPGAGFNEVTHGTVPAPAPNYHPTVKPVALMRYLVRLVTRRGGTVLDPFAGSGTTMVAAILEERFPIGIELTDEYHPIIRGRCDHAAANLQMALF